MLLAIWILFVQAHQPATADFPSGRVIEFWNQQAEFETQADCEAYASSKSNELLNMMFSGGKHVSFPSGTTATHDCRTKP